MTNGADTELFAPRDRAAARARARARPRRRARAVRRPARLVERLPDRDRGLRRRSLARRPRALMLVFVGDGDEREAIEELVRGAGDLRSRPLRGLRGRPLAGRDVRGRRPRLPLSGQRRARDRPPDEARGVSRRRTSRRRLRDPGHQRDAGRDRRRRRRRAARPVGHGGRALRAARRSLRRRRARPLGTSARSSSATRGGRSPTAWRPSSSSPPPRRA